MIWGLIFLIFICGLCEMCVMNSSKVYTAKENENITIKWSTQKTDLTLIDLICEFYSDNFKILYKTVNGSSESPDEQFVGRVHLDIDAPREAKIRLHLSRLKTEDSGYYCCYMNANYDSVAERWRLKMTECFDLNVTTGGNNNPSNIATTADAEHLPGGSAQRNRCVIGLSVCVVGLVVYIF
ncbi:hypothetical protein CHARACLAT_016939 [Characodon lateralis]|uniref:Ig-like domain-containing protein n=1 Tax=Characodon lateralis TaxID=208331 RepID=A0ABU7F4R2_9TELE|nr:hypothetical protein [Characodon lateralis]